MRQTIKLGNQALTPSGQESKRKAWLYDDGDDQSQGFYCLAFRSAGRPAGGEDSLPANRNIKWALSSALWNYQPPCPFTTFWTT